MSDPRSVGDEDESVRLFEAEQARIRQAGGSMAYFGSTVWTGFRALAGLSVVMIALVTVVQYIPRNDDGVPDRAYSIPLALVCGTGALCALRFRWLRSWQARWMGWGVVVAFGLLFPIASLLDAIR